MSARRRLQMTGYGTAPMPPMKPGGFPLPPPPDGKPPIRLPVGVAAQRREPDEMMPPPVEDQTGQSDEEMLRLLMEKMGQRPDQM